MYLEPGEVQALAEALRAAAGRTWAHPRQGLFLALAAALEDMVAGAGVVVAPASRYVVRQAALTYVRGGGVRPERTPPAVGRAD